MTERIDAIGFGGLRLIQDPEEFCYGVDAVILADFAARQSGFYETDFEGKPTKRRRQQPRFAVDLGTGTGIIPLILSHKTTCRQIVGIEVQEDSFQRAIRNLQMNHLQERLNFIHGDVKDVGSLWGAQWAGSVDMVTSNPPYTKGNGGIPNGNLAKAIARHETTAGIEDFLRCGAQLLKKKGDFYMVHRPSRLTDICWYGRKYGLEPKEICFVSANRDSAPNILLVHMIKGAKDGLRMLDPLFVYEEDGSYTKRLRACYQERIISSKDLNITTND